MKRDQNPGTCKWKTKVTKWEQKSNFSFMTINAKIIISSLIAKYYITHNKILYSAKLLFLYEIK